jgi:hydrogenase nickel incorporation protein HypA/HybF
MAAFLLASMETNDGTALERRSMHELALSLSIVDLVVERAAAERLRTVSRVVVEVGAAAGVDPEALRFCFEAVTEETAARGAELVIVEVPRRVRCGTCRHEFEPVATLAPCPACGRPGAELVQGRQLRVTSFDGE